MEGMTTRLDQTLMRDPSGSTTNVPQHTWIPFPMIHCQVKVLPSNTMQIPSSGPNRCEPGKRHHAPDDPAHPPSRTSYPLRDPVIMIVGGRGMTSSGCPHEVSRASSTKSDGSKLRILMRLFRTNRSLCDLFVRKSLKDFHVGGRTHPHNLTIAMNAPTRPATSGKPNLRISLQING